jgi:hypothetical protein
MRTAQRNLQDESAAKLENVLFGRFEQTFDEANEATTLAVNAGIASYSSFPVPNSDLVNGWVKDGIEANLVDQLNDKGFETIESVEFNFKNGKNNSETDNTDSEPVDEVEPSGIESDRAVDNGNSNTIAVISGSAAGGAVALIAAAVIALWAVRRRKKVVRIEDMNPVIIDDSDLSLQPKTSSDDVAPKSMAVVDERSLAESESEWTVATEAGDSMALKSICPNNATAMSRLGAAASTEMILSESFERDRQVSLTKDMLTGQWSGRCATNTRNGVMSESVLQPSHFSASQERRVRRAAQKQAATTAAAASNSPGGETNSCSSDDSSSDDSVVFAQAHEGTANSSSISPSKKRERRGRSPPPPRSNPRNRRQFL